MASSSSNISLSVLSDVGDMTSDDVMVQKRLRTVGDDGDLNDTQIYLSVVWQQGKLGLAYYDVDSCQMFIMPDVVDTESFDLLKTVRQQVQPRQIIISSKQDDRLLSVFKDIHNQEKITDVLKNDFIQVLPSIDFSFDVCKRRLLSLSLPSMPEHMTQSERSIHISALVNLDCVNMVRALGGLLKYLDKNRTGVELEQCDTRVPILSLTTFSIDKLMVIDEVSYRALQIFCKESHPSVYKSGSCSSSKEGLSLYGITNRCKSQIGSRMLRLWYLQPSKDIKLLQNRQDAIEFFVDPSNIEVTTTLQDCLRNIKNVPRCLSRMTQNQASVSDWQALYKTTYNAVYIGDICRAQTKPVDIFKKIGQTFTEDLHKIASLISKIVDFEECIVQNRFVVKPGVDPELDDKKRTYNGLPDFMTKVAKEELNHLGDEIKECNICYVPQLGYLLSVQKLDRMKASEDYHMDGLDFVFDSNNMVYYKNKSTRHLDQLLGDTHCDIADNELLIMHGLQNTILEHSQVLLDVMEYAAQLDCLISLAICAKEFNYVRPQLTEESVLHITGGRHALQELCITPFVPNHTHSGGDTSKIKVLTGPNASGKSVYLKQVALIVCLAQIGSFVPAECAVVGLVDRIFTRVRTMESVSVGLSTFMIDLNQVSSALHDATGRSLVILDEFGKGTESCDGLSLLVSTLKYWLDNASCCPHLFVSTHFLAIVQECLLPKSPQVSYQTMDVVEHEGELVFLYQLIDGHVNTSYACHVAKQAGIPQEIVERGQEVSLLLQAGKPIYRVDSAGTEIQMKRCSTICERFLELDLETCDVEGFLKNFVIPTNNGIEVKLTEL